MREFTFLSHYRASKTTDDNLECPLHKEAPAIHSSKTSRLGPVIIVKIPKQKLKRSLNNGFFTRK